jgi:inosine/xanthosine triphosphate pyrophosphatase family protein
MNHPLVGTTVVTICFVSGNAQKIREVDFIVELINERLNMLNSTVKLDLFNFNSSVDEPYDTMEQNLKCKVLNAQNLITSNVISADLIIVEDTGLEIKDFNLFAPANVADFTKLKGGFKNACDAIFEVVPFGTKAIFSTIAAGIDGTTLVVSTAKGEIEGELVQYCTEKVDSYDCILKVQYTFDSIFADYAILSQLSTNIKSKIGHRGKAVTEIITNYLSSQNLS